MLAFLVFVIDEAVWSSMTAADAVKWVKHSSICIKYSIYKSCAQFGYNYADSLRAGWTGIALHLFSEIKLSPGYNDSYMYAKIITKFLLRVEKVSGETRHALTNI